MNYQKKLLLFATITIICFGSLFFVFFTDLQTSMESPKKSFQEQIQGDWQPIYGLREIFQGKVHIIYVKSRPGSFNKRLMIIYDQQQNGLMCSPLYTENAEFACLLIHINKKRLTADDYAHLINNRFSSDLDLIHVIFKLDENKLIILGSLVPEKACPTKEGCQYKVISQLKKQND